ncbi:hypothetical protein ABZ865_02300 [Streptomyces sp. NPDC047085]|uniref:hypothetical protein n=1 Tax=Streptomyces sp. NPDC047085 TaxID=3155140 RepID=UPI003403895E
MRISARADYALRAVLEVAVRQDDGPVKAEEIAAVRPTGLSYTGTAQPLLPLWIALRANVRRILEGVTIADLAADALPEPVRALAAEPAAWENP